jgi:hypothetical protein
MPIYFQPITPHYIVEDKLMLYKTLFDYRKIVLWSGLIVWDWYKYTSDSSSSDEG